MLNQLIIMTHFFVNFFNRFAIGCKKMFRLNVLIAYGTDVTTIGVLIYLSLIRGLETIGILKTITIFFGTIMITIEAFFMCIFADTVTGKVLARTSIEFLPFF